MRDCPQDPQLVTLIAGAAAGAVITNIVNVWLERGRAKRDRQLHLIDIKREKYAAFLGFVARYSIDLVGYVRDAEKARNDNAQPGEVPAALQAGTYELIFLAEEIGLLNEDLGRVAKNVQEELNEKVGNWEWVVAHDKPDDTWTLLDTEDVVGTLRDKFFGGATADLGTGIGRFQRFRRRLASRGRRFVRRAKRVPTRTRHRPSHKR